MQIVRMEGTVVIKRDGIGVHKGFTMGRGASASSTSLADTVAARDVFDPDPVCVPEDAAHLNIVDRSTLEAARVTDLARQLQRAASRQQKMKTNIAENVVSRNVRRPGLQMLAVELEKTLSNLLRAPHAEIAACDLFAVLDDHFLRYAPQLRSDNMDLLQPRERKEIKTPLVRAKMLKLYSDDLNKARSVSKKNLKTHVAGGLQSYARLSQF